MPSGNNPYDSGSKRGIFFRFFGKRELTLEEKQNITKERLLKVVTDCYAQMKLSYDNGQRLAYKNPLGLTSEQVYSSFSQEELLEMFRLNTLLKDVLNLANPGTVEDGDDDVYG